MCALTNIKVCSGGFRKDCSMAKIVTITINPAVDIYTDVEKVVPVRKLRCSTARREAGGGGINVARVLKRLDADVQALFPAGGSIGDLLERLIKAEKLPYVRIPSAGETRESLTAEERGSGEQYRFVFEGTLLEPAAVRACLKTVETLCSEASVLVASGSLRPGVPEDFYAQLAALAHDRGIHFILDTSGAALRGALGPGLGLIKPNLRELSDLVGAPLPGKAEQLRACEQLIADGSAAMVALTLGEEGALLVTGQGAWEARAPQVDVLSPVGAGDSFTAGMAYGLHSGWPTDQAFRLGIAAGTAAVMTAGTALCRREDVWALFDQIEKEGLIRRL
jgi:6-phosphofructokinase 2